jgi:putative multiple sugar transport system substrate-binding protein
MKKMLRPALSGILILALLICGCSSSKAPEAAQENVVSDSSKGAVERVDDGRTVVGISMPDRLLERWNRDGAYLKKQFENADCEVILSYANNLIDTQIADIRQMIADGADLLVITAVDGAALTTVLDEAASVGIKIIAYDRLIMGTDAVDYYVSFDNYMVGVLQAEYVITALNLRRTGRHKYIEFVTGDPVDNNARYFYQGAMDTLKPYLESGKLEVPSSQTEFYETSTAQWSTDIAQQRLQIILSSYYPAGTRLDAVLCANDSTALGATRALQSDYKGKNSVIVTGQDGDIANIYNILDGIQSMTVYKHLEQESVVTVALGKDIISGNTPGEDLISKSHWDFDCSYDTQQYNNGNRVVPSYLLSPIAITLDNLEKELFESGIYKRNSSGLIYTGE